jgi:hypothetical protein
MNVQGKITAGISLVILIIFLLALTPTIVDQVQGLLYVGASGSVGRGAKWNFTGNAGALTILGLLPFAWVAGVLLAGLAGVWVIATRGKD